MPKVIIEAKNLEKQYMKQKVVKHADFKIEEGMICGLIGPNGAGKTTIMKNARRSDSSNGWHYHHLWRQF